MTGKKIKIKKNVKCDKSCAYFHEDEDEICRCLLTDKIVFSKRIKSPTYCEYYEYYFKKIKDEVEIRIVRNYESTRVPKSFKLKFGEFIAKEGIKALLAIIVAIIIAFLIWWFGWK